MATSSRPSRYFSQGNPTDISLAPGEQIIAVFSRSGAAMDQIGFETQLPDKTLRRHGPFGGTRGNPLYIIGKVISLRQKRKRDRCRRGLRGASCFGLCLTKICKDTRAVVRNAVGRVLVLTLCFGGPQLP